jgi:hypothetical protein
MKQTESKKHITHTQQQYGGFSSSNHNIMKIEHMFVSYPDSLSKKWEYIMVLMTW